LDFARYDVASAAETDANVNKIRIEYFDPDPPDATLRRVYELAKERRPLERMQEIFSALKLNGG